MSHLDYIKLSEIILGETLGRDASNPLSKEELAKLVEDFVKNNEKSSTGPENS